MRNITVAESCESFYGNHQGWGWSWWSQQHMVLQNKLIAIVSRSWTIENNVNTEQEIKFLQVRVNQYKVIITSFKVTFSHIYHDIGECLGYTAKCKSKTQNYIYKASTQVWKKSIPV